MNARPPEHDDQAAQSASVAAVAGSAHHGDDLLHGWRIGRVALSFVCVAGGLCEIPASSPATADDRRRRAATRS
jgi:hypothetical protein